LNNELCGNQIQILPSYLLYLILKKYILIPDAHKAKVKIGIVKHHTRKSSIEEREENLMNAFDLLSLIASVICISFGIVIYSFNRRALLNKLFLITSFFGFFYAFTEVMMWQSSSFETASLWSKMGSIWPFFVVLVVHFALAFTGNKWLKNKFTYLFLYLPALLFCIVGLFSYLINAPPIMEYWGYEDISTGTLVNRISTIWAAVLPILAFVLCFRYYRAKTDETQKQQRKFVTIGFAIPIFTYVITNMMFPSFGVYTPNLGHFAVLFFSVFVGYAILKHELFTFDAALAAENILSTIPDSLTLTSMNGKMLRVNRRLVNFLGYEEKELLGKPIVKLFSEDSQCASILTELAGKKVIRNHELTCKTTWARKKQCYCRAQLFEAKLVEILEWRA
jgi:PAS domain-containing protein